MTFFMTQSVFVKAGSEWTAYIQQLCGNEDPYGSTQHLIEDALDNGLPRPFVRHLLEVRCNKGTRKKWVHLQQSWGTNDRYNHWIGPFQSFLWTLYTAFRK